MSSQLAASPTDAATAHRDATRDATPARDRGSAAAGFAAVADAGAVAVASPDATIGVGVGVGAHGARGAAGGHWRRVLLGLLLPVSVLVAVELAVRGGLIPANMLPAPSQILDTLRDLGAQGLAGHIVASTLRVVAGFAAGAVLAVLLGAAVGLSRHAEAILDPSFQALRAIPSLAWVPLLLLWLGIDEAPKIVLIAIGAFFPIYMGVASGIRGVDRKLIEVARLYRLSNVALTRRVLLPAALPAILTGLRNGLSLAWMFMVAAELIAASKGLGYLLSDGRETSRADIVLAAIFLLAILGKISDSLMAAIEKRSLAWRDSYA
jgi:sulfonate transport system permease protein